MRWPRVQRVKRFKLLYEKNHDTYNIEPESQGSKGIRLVENFVDYSAGRDARSRKGEGMGVARLLLSTCARSQWEATMARGSWDESNKSGEVISRPETHRGKRSDATFRWFISVIQLSSSSASIPPFNSRPAINNLPAIVPSLFLFIPPLSRDARFSKFVWLETRITDRVSRIIIGRVWKTAISKIETKRVCARWKRLAGSDYESGDNVTGILVQVYNAISKVYRNVAAKG